MKFTNDYQAVAFLEEEGFSIGEGYITNPYYESGLISKQDTINKLYSFKQKEAINYLITEWDYCFDGLEPGQVFNL